MGNSRGALSRMIRVTCRAALAAWVPVATLGHAGAPVFQFRANAGHPVSLLATLDRSAILMGSNGTVRMEIVLRGDTAGPVERLQTDLVVVIDVSGSMTGDKLDHAKSALRALISRLDERDRLALVAYSSHAWTPIPLVPAKATSKTRWQQVIDTLRAGGMTNLAEGLDVGTNILRESRDRERATRLLVISDGLANRGDASFGGLTARARKARLEGFGLSSVGVGLHFNEELMTALADEGAGQYYYVEQPEGLERMFSAEFAAARQTVARGLALHVRPGPGVRLLDAAGYPLEARDDEVVLHPGPLYAGQERRFWLTFALSSDTAGGRNLAQLRLRYRSDGEERQLELQGVPRVRCVAGRDDFLSRVYVSAWERGVASQVYGALKEEVARDVRAGDRASALKRIAGFRGRYESLGKELDSANLDPTLADAERLAEEVRGAFGRGATPDDRARLIKRYIDTGRLTKGR